MVGTGNASKSIGGGSGSGSGSGSGGSCGGNGGNGGGGALTERIPRKRPKTGSSSTAHAEKPSLCAMDSVGDSVGAGRVGSQPHLPPAHHVSPPPQHQQEKDRAASCAVTSVSDRPRKDRHHRHRRNDNDEHCGRRKSCVVDMHEVGHLHSQPPDPRPRYEVMHVNGIPIEFTSLPHERNVDCDGASPQNSICRRMRNRVRAADHDIQSRFPSQITVAPSGRPEGPPLVGNLPSQEITTRLRPRQRQPIVMDVPPTRKPYASAGDARKFLQELCKLDAVLSFEEPKHVAEEKDVVTLSGAKNTNEDDSTASRRVGLLLNFLSLVRQGRNGEISVYQFMRRFKSLVTKYVDAHLPANEGVSPLGEKREEREAGQQKEIKMEREQSCHEKPQTIEGEDTASRDVAERRSLTFGLYPTRVQEQVKLLYRLFEAFLPDRYCVDSVVIPDDQRAMARTVIGSSGGENDAGKPSPSLSSQLLKTNAVVESTERNTFCPHANEKIPMESCSRTNTVVEWNVLREDDGGGSGGDSSDGICRGRGRGRGSSEYHDQEEDQLKKSTFSTVDRDEGDQHRRPRGQSECVKGNSTSTSNTPSTGNDENSCPTNAKATVSDQYLSEQQQQQEEQDNQKSQRGDSAGKKGDDVGDGKEHRDSDATITDNEDNGEQTGSSGVSHEHSQVHEAVVGERQESTPDSKWRDI